MNCLKKKFRLQNQRIDMVGAGCRCMSGEGFTACVAQEGCPKMATTILLGRDPANIIFFALPSYGHNMAGQTSWFDPAPIPFGP